MMAARAQKLILIILFNFIFLFYFQVMSRGNDFLTHQEILKKFFNGQTAYKQADYAQAIGFYEDILKNGWGSGALYYNLGNSYLKNGQLGQALLNYERASRLIPRDSDLRFNLEYARAQAGLSKETSENLLALFFRNFADFYTLRELMIILAILLVLLGLVHILSLFFSAFLRVRIFVLAVIVFIFSGYFCAVVYKIQVEKSLAVAVSAADSKYEPRQEATIYFRLSEGVKVRILKIESGWVKIQLWDGKQGWVPQESVEKI